MCGASGYCITIFENVYATKIKRTTRKTNDRSKKERALRDIINAKQELSPSMPFGSRARTRTSRINKSRPTLPLTDRPQRWTEMATDDGNCILMTV